jgi:dTDP-4-dehydrorhamnose reductase
VRQAAGRGWNIVGTYLTRVPDCEAVRLDVRDQGAVQAVFDSVRPSRVIHTAYTQFDEFVTRDGAANVAAASTARRARLVHVSTDVVFSGRLGRPYREGDQVDPVTAYGRAKAEAERLVSRTTPGAAIVRTSLLVPGRYEDLALAAAEGNAAYPFFDDELRCPIAVADAAAALIELAHLPFAGPIHVAGADAVSRHELACLIARAHGKPTRTIPSASGAAEAGRPADCRLDSGLARSMLQTPLRGVRDVFQPE